MLLFAARRVGQGVATLLVATLLFFTSIYILPGDPIRALFGLRPPAPEVLAGLKASYGLDQPYVVQYLRYLGRLLHGDLGVSYYGRTVREILAPAVPRSVALLLAVVVVEVVLVGAATVVAARAAGRWPDRLLRGATLALVGIPVIVLAYLLQQTLGQGLGWLPRTVDFGPHDDWTSWILPVAALSLWFAAVLARQTHDALDRGAHEPHVKVAVAKGLSEARVTGVHALRPVLAPAIHLAGAQIGQLVTGLVIVEGIFDVGGVGSVLEQAIYREDRAVVVGAATALLIVVVIATALTDVLAIVVDPRQRP